MSPALDQSAFDALSTGARHGALPEALALLGEAVTGARGFVCNAGFAILGAASAGEADAAVDGRGRPVADDRLRPIEDPVVEALGLRLARVEGGIEEADQARLSLFALAARLGIAARMLDRAHAHLKPRRSFGQKTLAHQLVKAGFADVHGVVLGLREKAQVRLAEGAIAGLQEDHRTLCEADGEAERLMGGHGYLEGGTHELAHLSMLLASLYGRGTCD